MKYFKNRVNFFMSFPYPFPTPPKIFHWHIYKHVVEPPTENVTSRNCSHCITSSMFFSITHWHIKCCMTALRRWLWHMHAFCNYITPMIMVRMCSVISLFWRSWHSCIVHLYYTYIIMAYGGCVQPLGFKHRVSNVGSPACDNVRVIK